MAADLASSLVRVNDSFSTISLLIALNLLTLLHLIDFAIAALVIKASEIRVSTEKGAFDFQRRIVFISSKPNCETEKSFGICLVTRITLSCLRLGPINKTIDPQISSLHWPNNDIYRPKLIK